MAENKKLNIQNGDPKDSKKLVLKKAAGSSGLKIKSTQLPNLNETPDPGEQKPDSTPPKGLTIKGTAAPQEQAPDSTPPKGLTIKGTTAPQEQTPDSTPPKGLTIKGTTAPQEQAPDSTPPKGLTIKSSTSSQDSPQEQTPQQTAPKGLTIKGTKAPQEQTPSSTPPKGLTIKGTKAPQEQAPSSTPPKGLTIKGTKAPQEQTPQQTAPAPQGLNIQPQPNPLSTPPPIPAPSFVAPATSSKPPPPMPAGYTAPPAPQPAVNPQGPMFPTQGNKAQQKPQAQTFNTGEPAVNPQGPVFPTQNQSPAASGARPPGTMPPPTHKKGTSAPLSAIMGEVKAAKKIPQQHNPAPDASSNNKQEVVKVKKPAGVVKDSLGNEFCLIPQGKYFIGIENEVEEVKVSFTLGKYPVTKEQYLEFMTDTGTKYSPEELNVINKIAPYPNCPAVMVSWNDAKAYCRWLREKTGEYYALPSIKEWEAASRSADGRIYPWGDEEPTSEIACFNDGYLEPQSTCSVDWFQNNVSPFGCVGMIGNVMEWTLDSFEDERNPHILKGGSWMSPIDFCNNVTPCMSFPEDKRKDFFGFRLLYLPKELYQKYKSSS